MGVHGLWKLIEPSGKPVPVETLENKVLAVDVSIWLHQVVKGFQDSKGASLPNAHLLGIYHRICKLLYFKIKPIFVFDGGIPALKKQTIARRNQLKSQKISEANSLQQQLLKTLLKHSAVSKVLSEKAKASITKQAKKSPKNDIYVLPINESDDSNLSLDSEEEEQISEISNPSPVKQWDIHTIDTKSNDFKSLPVDVRHEILTELKETRKQSSWGRLHEIPKQSDNFSSYQMKRLLKRQAVQSALDDVSKEMDGNSLTLNELESLLKEKGILSTNVGKTIAADENTKYVYLDKNRDKQISEKVNDSCLEETKNKDVEQQAVELSLEENVTLDFDSTNEDEDEDIKKAIALSLEDVPSTSNSNTKLKYSNCFTEQKFESDSSDDGVAETSLKNKFSSVESYMIEYTGLTPSEIGKILHNEESKNKDKLQSRNVIKKLVPNQRITDTSLNQAEPPISKDITSSGKSDRTYMETNKLKEKKISVELEEISNAVVNIISESEDSSLEELDVSETKGTIEIKINPNEEIEDDLFADIFSDPNSKNNEKLLEADEKSKAGVKENNSVTIKEICAPLEKSIGNKPQFDDAEDNLKKNENVISQINPDTIKSTPISKEKISLTIKEMEELKNNLQQEKIGLMIQKSAKERMATDITDQMYQESQELLELFGVPYIIAPMEAEAQCAFLDAIQLTDGTITDDSDIWLFGGRTVYKNFFNQSKYVMEFKVEDIKHHFKLDREQMILLALLVGSDYTSGIQGIGPVTALEILATFPPSRSTEITLSHEQLLSGLKEFKSWYSKGQTGGLSRSTLKGKLKNIDLRINFPNIQVVQAYLEPNVETSKEKFSWAKPDILGLTVFANEKFGWSSKKTNEILRPVIQRLKEKQTQKSIKDFFKTKHKLYSEETKGKMSKRVKTAVDRFGKSNEELIAEEMETLKKEKQKNSKRKIKKNSDESKNKKASTTTEKTIIEQPDQNVSISQSNDHSNEGLNTKIKEKKKIPIKSIDNQSSPKETCVKDSEVNVEHYEQLATQLRMRRQQKNKLQGAKQTNKWLKRTQKQDKNNIQDLSNDEDINVLQATTIRSKKRVDEITRAIENKLQDNINFRSLSSLPKKEIIHQKLRDKTDLLRNKMKAIETFRKSKHGPGYVQKRQKKKVMPKEDAGLSEDSDE